MGSGTASNRQHRGTGAGAGEAAARRGPERAEPPRPLHGGRSRSPGGAGGAQLLLLQPGLHVSGAEGRSRSARGGEMGEGRENRASPGSELRPAPPQPSAESRSRWHSEHRWAGSSGQVCRRSRGGAVSFPCPNKEQRSAADVSPQLPARGFRAAAR